MADRRLNMASRVKVIIALILLSVLANEFQYKFTMVLLPNGEVTVDECKCIFEYDEDNDEWEKKYLA